MRIGLTYSLKSEHLDHADLPDDYQEEFDSLATVESVAGVLRGLGLEVMLLGDGPEMVAKLLADRPDFVFNFAEGRGVGRCREARAPAVLELLGIPYTGSDPLTLAATLDKDVARRLASSHEVVVPWGRVFAAADDVSAAALNRVLKHGPWIVKPAWEGSSKGVRGKCVVDTAAEAATAIRELQEKYRQPVLVEEYIAGEELTVGVVGNDPARVVGVLRVVPRTAEERFVYSLEVKRDWRARVRYECPPALPDNDIEAVERAALKAFRALGCRDIARIDFRLRDGVAYFLEANPLPGLNPESGDLVILAGLAGWSYEQLIGGILQAATARAAKDAAAGGT